MLSLQGQEANAAVKEGLRAVATLGIETTLEAETVAGRRARAAAKASPDRGPLLPAEVDLKVHRARSIFFVGTSEKENVVLLKASVLILTGRETLTRAKIIVPILPK